MCDPGSDRERTLFFFSYSLMNFLPIHLAWVFLNPFVFSSGLFSIMFPFLSMNHYLYWIKDYIPAECLHPRYGRIVSDMRYNSNVLYCVMTDSSMNDSWTT